MRILFLGNSYTHRGPLPLQLHQLAALHDLEAVVFQAAPEAATLHDHLFSDEVEHTVRFGGWDAVVLQDHSTRATESLGDPEEHVEDVNALAEFVHVLNPTARIVLVQTWARHPDHMDWVPDPEHRFYPNEFPDPRSMLEEVTAGIAAAEGRLRVERPEQRVSVAWLGDAWRACQDSLPELRLHDEDGSHPGSAGQWLNALLLFELLFERTAMAAPAAVPSELLEFARTWSR